MRKKTYAFFLSFLFLFVGNYSYSKVRILRKDCIAKNIKTLKKMREIAAKSKVEVRKFDEKYYRAKDENGIFLIKKNCFKKKKKYQKRSPDDISAEDLLNEVEIDEKKRKEGDDSVFRPYISSTLMRMRGIHDVFGNASIEMVTGTRIFNKFYLEGFNKISPSSTSPEVFEFGEFFSEFTFYSPTLFSFTLFAQLAFKDGDDNDVIRGGLINKLSGKIGSVKLSLKTTFVPSQVREEGMRAGTSLSTSVDGSDLDFQISASYSGLGTDDVSTSLKFKISLLKVSNFKFFGQHSHRFSTTNFTTNTVAFGVEIKGLE